MKYYEYLVKYCDAAKTVTSIWLNTEYNIGDQLYHENFDEQFVILAILRVITL